MSVEQFRGQYTPTCDGRDGECLERLAGEMSFEDAREAMHRAGWLSKKSETTKRYQNFCRECRKDVKRLAVYCIHCEMWFDTAKGWQAKKSPFGTPVCPRCSAPLMQLDYEDFIKSNREQGRLDEVLTWEYPDGLYWKSKGDANG